MAAGMESFVKDGSAVEAPIDPFAFIKAGKRLSRDGSFEKLFCDSR